MKIFRIADSAYIHDISGTGAKLFGGRLNHKGTPLLYCSENISLAILEILVHFDGLTIPDNLELLELEIDENEIETFPISKFNNIRKAPDAEYAFKKAGQKWIESNTSLALKVPSIITSGEFNILINPNHAHFENLKKMKTSKLDLDKRLFK